MPTVSIRKKKSSWEYRIYVGIIDGKARRISKSGFSSRREASHAADLFLKDNKQLLEPVTASNRISFGAFLDFWLTNYCAVNLKPTSVHDYRKRIEYIIKPRLGECEIHELTPMMMQQFIMDIFNAGYTRNALATIKGILTSSLRYAVMPAGILSSSPASYIRLPLARAKPATQPQEHKRVPLTPDQWLKLMQRFPLYHPSHIALNLGYHLGLRLGEAFGLCWEDIDFEAQTVSIKRQVQYDDDRKCWYFTEPKYDSYRTISMDPALSRILRQELDRQEGARKYLGSRYHQICIDRNLCFTDHGTPVHLVNTREDGSYIQPRTMQYISRVAHQELDLPLFDFHTLRHTHATMLIEAGADMADIQERLGHAKVGTTKRYVHDTDLQRQRTCKLLCDLFPDTGNP